MQRPEDDRLNMSYNSLCDEIAMCMGGRIAEEIIYKDVTTGAMNDIQQATKYAHDMIYRYGMSKKLGFLSLDTSQQVFIGRDYQTKNEFSEKLASEADDEIREILDSNYKRAKKLLADNVDLMHEMVKLLKVRETIYKDEVDMIMQGKKADEIALIMNQREQEQKAKEDALRKQRERETKIDTYKQKVKEGEKLLASGIITEKEYEAIKKEYDEFEKSLKAEEAKPEKTEEVKKTKAVEKPKTAEEKTEKPKPIVRKHTDEKQAKKTDKKGE